MTPRLKWNEWQGSYILGNLDTHRNVAWVQQYPDLGWSVQLWGMHKGKPDWKRIAHVPELDAAKMIALLNVEGKLV